MKVLMVLFLCLSLGCGHCRPSKTNLQEILNSSVLVEVDAVGVLLTEQGAQEVQVPLKYGSGVVVSKTDGSTQAPYSVVLTAAHVLNAPTSGEVIVGPQGMLVVQSITYKIRTADYRECDASPVVIGDQGLNDVGSLVVFCNAGDPIELADSVPEPGSEVYSVAHPHASLEPLITNGYVTGWSPNGFFISSNAIASGSSGGGLFYNNKLIGLTVRADARDFFNKALSTPLQNLKVCLHETNLKLGL